MVPTKHLELGFFSLLSKPSPSVLKFEGIAEQMSPAQSPQIITLAELDSYGQNLSVIPHATALVRICHVASCRHFLAFSCRPEQPMLYQQM